MTSTQNTNTARRLIRRAWKLSPDRQLHGPVSEAYEHGQWWSICLCGASWAVVDAIPGLGDTGLDFEQVATGEEDFHS